MASRWFRMHGLDCLAFGSCVPPRGRLRRQRVIIAATRSSVPPCGRLRRRAKGCAGEEEGVPPCGRLRRVPGRSRRRCRRVPPYGRLRRTPGRPPTPAIHIPPHGRIDYGLISRKAAGPASNRATQARRAGCSAGSKHTNGPSYPASAA